MKCLHSKYGFDCRRKLFLGIFFFFLVATHVGYLIKEETLAGYNYERCCTWTALNATLLCYIS